MSRGNQRDRDRERAQARAGNKQKQSKTDGLTPLPYRNRNPRLDSIFAPSLGHKSHSTKQSAQRDAKALQEKQARKAAKESAGANGGKMA